MRFALIGKIDVNRDGRDDRDDLKRMIEAAGGIVDYDLPPPEAGKETGKLTGRDAWYVIDDRMPFVLEVKTGEEGHHRASRPSSSRSSRRRSGRRGSTASGRCRSTGS